MALDDVLFDQGEETNFILELPPSSYSGALSDIVIGNSDGTNSSDSLMYNIPVAASSSGFKAPAIGGRHMIRSND